MFVTPIGPRACKAVHDLFRRSFARITLFFREFSELLFVGHLAAEPGGNALFGDRFQRLGNSGFAKIFLRENVCCNVGPRRWHLDFIRFESDRAVGVRDFRCALLKDYVAIDVFSLLCEMPRNFHKLPLLLYTNLQPQTFICGRR